MSNEVSENLVPGSHVLTSRFTVMVFGIAALIMITALQHDGIALMAIPVFLLACTFVACQCDDNLGILSWQAGIPMYYCTMFLFLPLINRLFGEGDTIGDRELGHAMLVATLGMVAFGVGAALMRRVSSAGPARNLLKGSVFELLRSHKVLVFLCGIGALSVVWSYFFGYYGLIASADEVGNAAGAVSGLTIFLFIAHLVTWNRYFAGREKRYLWLGMVTTLILVLSGVLSNSKTAIILPVLFIALSLWGVSGKIPLKLLSVSLVLFVSIAFPFVTASRYVVFVSGSDLSKLEVISATVDYLLSFDWLSQIETYSEYGATKSLGRGLLQYFTIIVQQTGTAVEYLDGKTLSCGLEAFVPRFLHPDKPSLNIGNWTSHHYGLLASGDTITSLSPSLMGELFMNFGAMGVLAGMALLGTVAVYVDRRIIVSRDHWVMPYAMFCVGWQESIVGQSFLPFIKNMILVWVVLYILSRASRFKCARV